MENVETGYSLQREYERESRKLNAPILRLELKRELEDLRNDEAFISEGHSGKTIAKYSDLRVVLVAFKKGMRMGEHHTPERLSIQTLTGHVRVHLPDQKIDLPAGTLISLERDFPHDVEALEESSILLTLSWRGRPPGQDPI